MASATLTRYTVYRISGDRIRASRKRAKLTQARLAQRMGVSFQLVSAWETGLRAPHANLVYRLSQVLGVEMIELYEPLDREW